MISPPRFQGKPTWAVGTGVRDVDPSDEASAGRILVSVDRARPFWFVAWRSGVHREFRLMVELPSMDMAVVTRVELGELALERGTGNVIDLATMRAGAMARRGGAGREDLAPRPV